MFLTVLHYVLRRCCTMLKNSTPVLHYVGRRYWTMSGSSWEIAHLLAIRPLQTSLLPSFTASASVLHYVLNLWRRCCTMFWRCWTMFSRWTCLRSRMKLEAWLFQNKKRVQHRRWTWRSCRCGPIHCEGFRTQLHALRCSTSRICAKAIASITASARSLH